jgi:hypothetical protein
MCVQSFPSSNKIANRAKRKVIAEEYLTTNFFGMSELTPQTAFIPSLSKYDESGACIESGYKADEIDKRCIKWFKLLLSSDDDSAIRRVATERLETLEQDEETVIVNFLEYIFTGLRDQLKPFPGEYSLEILAAQPRQIDQLSPKRYRHCLSEAAKRVKFKVKSINIFPESVATAFNYISKHSDIDNVLLIIHDGGAGTTDVHIMFIYRGVDNSLQWEDIHAPRYLNCGGDEFDRLYLEFIKGRYPELSDQQVRAFVNLGKRIKMYEDSARWSLDKETQLLLPLLPENFKIDLTFRTEIDEILESVNNQIFKYLVEEIRKGHHSFHKRRELWEEHLHSLQQHRSPSEVVASINRAELQVAALEKCTNLIVSSGGQSSDPRMQRILKSQYGDEWRLSPNPRTAVIDGLLYMRNADNLHLFKGGFGFYGWNETKKEYKSVLNLFWEQNSNLLSHRDDGATYSKAMRIWQKTSRSYLFRPVRALIPLDMNF